MLPFVFEWQWDVGHFLFMGLFYLALGVISIGLSTAFVSTLMDLAVGKVYMHHGHDEHDEEAEA
jgi:hypothetical protein